MSEVADKAVVRVRHPLKLRLLQVARVHDVTPHLRRVTLAGDDLQDFVSASFDDHVKLFFPAPGEARPELPALGPNGVEFRDDRPRPVMRDFTPRRYDNDARELELEFALHEAGPATDWASRAQPGDWLGVGGPRGSLVIGTGFDWHLLIGDDTALPAIARRLSELPAGARAIAVLEVVDASARLAFDTRADLRVIWCHRDDAAPDAPPLLSAIRALVLPDGDGYVWAAGESADIRAVRQHLASERGIDKSRIRAAAYWKRGAPGVHENLED